MVLTNNLFKVKCQFHLQVQQLGHLIPIKDKEPIQVSRVVASIAWVGLFKKHAICGLK